jgi:uncharacterized membrane protein YfcA
LPELPLISWALIVLGAALIGIAKVGIPGTGILVVPIMALAMGDQAKASVGFLLPMLALADIMAIIYWRRHVNWSQLIRLLPWAGIGVILGYLGLQFIDNHVLKPFIGVIVLVLLMGSWMRDRLVSDDRIPTHWAFAAVMGILAGALSMMANAAGPIMIIYLLAMRFDKEHFIGTQAWFFWILNLSKMPFSLNLGLITASSFLVNLAMIPAIVVGGVLGVLLVHRISQQTFNRVVTYLAVIAAILLIAKP